MNRTLSFAILALLAAPIMSHGQSLGDIARQQKDARSQKSNSQSTSTQKKVFTDEDFAKSGSIDDSNVPATAKRSNSGLDKEKDHGSASADQWRAKIQQKKDVIAALQGRIDKLQASVNYVQNNRNVYTNAPEYNEHQHQRELLTERLKAELEQQKAELNDLQEEARQQGFGNSVYQ